jgi:hypothetical protein
MLFQVSTQAEADGQTQRTLFFKHPQKSPKNTQCLFVLSAVEMNGSVHLGRPNGQHTVLPFLLVTELHRWLDGFAYAGHDLPILNPESRKSSTFLNISLADDQAIVFFLSFQEKSCKHKFSYQNDEMYF